MSRATTVRQPQWRKEYLSQFSGRFVLHYTTVAQVDHVMLNDRQQLQKKTLTPLGAATR